MGNSNHVFPKLRLFPNQRPFLIPFSLVPASLLTITRINISNRGLQAVPALFLLIALIPFPLSPRWLAYKERYDEALEVIANIHGGGDKTSPVVEAEFRDVKQAAEEAKQVKWHMLFGRKMWRRTLVGCFTQIWQQLTGGNVLMYYIVIPILVIGDRSFLGIALERVLTVGVCVLYGGIDRECKSCIEFNPICHFCGYECSCNDIHRCLGTTKYAPLGFCRNGHLQFHLRRISPLNHLLPSFHLTLTSLGNPRNPRPRSPLSRRQSKRNMDTSRLLLQQSRNSKQLPLHRNLRSNLGPRSLGLHFRNLATRIPRQRSGSMRRLQLGI